MKARAPASLTNSNGSRMPGGGVIGGGSTHPSAGRRASILATGFPFLYVDAPALKPLR